MTGEESRKELLQRLERLENELRQLRREFVSLAPEESPAGPVPAQEKLRETVAERPVAVEESVPAPGPAAPWKTSEYWLGRIGIGLVLFGVIFLFKYAVDQGWLTPLARVAGGVAIGAGLLGWGLAVRRSRTVLSRLLAGGGIAAWYITGYAAFQVYGLVSHTTAFVLLSAVTALALGLGAAVSDPLLSVIGTGGGLSTPFMLYAGSGSVAGLVGYTSLVLAGAGVIFLVKGWRSLFVVAAVSGWSVFCLAAGQAGHWKTTASSLDRIVLETAIVLIGWLAFWLMPLAREVVEGGRWRAPEFGGALGHDLNRLATLSEKAIVPLAALLTPLLALAVSTNVWKLPNETWGWCAFGAAMVYAAGYVLEAGVSVAGHVLLHGREHRQRLPVHSFTAAFLLTLAFTLWFSGNLLLAVVAAEAVGLHLLSRRLNERPLVVLAFLIQAIITVAVAVRLFADIPPANPAYVLWNARTAADLFAIATLVATSFLVKDKNLTLAYRVVVHVLFMGLLLRELSVLPQGQAWVSASWGAYGIALLLAGLRLANVDLRRAGMLTLIVVVGKLFLVDLSRIAAIWRIVLFLCFGGLFLALSHWVRNLWRETAGVEAARPANAGSAENIPGGTQI